LGRTRVKKPDVQLTDIKLPDDVWTVPEGIITIGKEKIKTGGERDWESKRSGVTNSLNTWKLVPEKGSYDGRVTKAGASLAPVGGQSQLFNRIENQNEATPEVASMKGDLLERSKARHEKSYKGIKRKRGQKSSSLADGGRNGGTWQGGGNREKEGFKR